MMMIMMAMVMMMMMMGTTLPSHDYSPRTIYGIVSRGKLERESVSGGAVYEVMWKNTVEPHRPQMTV
jgi:hypothetical protein